MVIVQGVPVSLADELLTRGVATASVMFNPSFMFYYEFFGS